MAKACFPNAEVRCQHVGDRERPPNEYACPAGEPAPPADAVEIASQCRDEHREEEHREEEAHRHYGCPIGGVVAGIIVMIAVMVSCCVGLRMQPKETGDAENPQVCAASLSHADLRRKWRVSIPSS